MLLANLNTILYTLTYTKSYSVTFDNYVLVYNNNHSFTTDDVNVKKKFIITNYARIQIKHHLYETIYQNFPYIYKNILQNYSIINNLKGLMYSPKQEIQMFFNENTEEPRLTKLFGFNSLIISNNIKREPDEFFEKVFYRLCKNKKKINTIIQYQLTLLEHLEQENMQQHTRKKRTKITKLKPTILLALK